MPLNASALVIGVDVYDRADIPRLTGCAADACAAANWLVRIGVPADNIFLHLSQPVGATRPRTPVAVLEADMDSLNRSMQALQKRGGDQLFVLMSGHGLYVPVEGPIFLPSNYASPSTRTNLKINEYIRWFQSWPYRDQFLFYDACQNPTAAIGQVSAVQATGPDPDPATYRPLDGNGLIACYAVSPGQEAWAGDGSGVLTSQVIGELDPAHWASLSADAEQQDAILYDWTTGERRVDLKDLFNSIIKPAIEAQVTAAGHIGQTPYCQLNGRAEVEDQAPILTLPPEPCSQVSISVQPPEAAGAVDQLRLTIPTPSRRHYLRAPPETFAAPIMRLAPAGAVLEARCRERPGSGWRSRNSPLQEVLSHPAHALVFELDRPTVPPPPDDPYFNIRAVDPSGDPASPFGGAYGGAYGGVVADGGVAPPPGVTFSPHEYGPDIGFEPGAEAAAASYAQVWLRALRSNFASGDYDILLSSPGEPAVAGGSNMIFGLPDGGIAHLGGYLLDAPVVSIEPAGLVDQAQRRSLREIEQHPAERLEPGVYRLRIDLPWGGWAGRVTIGDDAQPVRCQLPEVVGVEPLRNRQLNGQDGIEQISGRRDELFFTDESADAACFSPGEYGVDLLVADVEDKIRVEPLSEAPLPEWDQLFSVGRLARVSDARAAELLKTEMPAPERSLLALGLAYAALEGGVRDVLGRSLEAIQGPLADSVDAQLLRHHLAFGDEGSDRGEAAVLFQDFEDAHRLPVLRWAAPMIQVLADRLQRPAPEWLSHLAPSSVWTVLTPEGVDLFEGRAETHDLSWADARDATPAAAVPAAPGLWEEADAESDAEDEALAPLLRGEGEA